MEVELQFKITVDGNSTEFSYKIENGKDQAMCDLIFSACDHLTHKMKDQINMECR